MTREHGRITAVTQETLGSTLTANAAAGATILILKDRYDFDEDGGTLLINDQVVTYDPFDAEDGTNQLAVDAALTAAADAGDQVALYDDTRNKAVISKTALVRLDGDDDNSDDIKASIPQSLVPEIPVGIRGDAGESVELEHDEDGGDWRIHDLQGAALSAGVKFWDQDTFTAAADGAQAFTLTHEPLDGSAHMGWGGLGQPHTEFSVAGTAVTVPDPSGLILAGDVFDFRYAYRDGVVTPAAFNLPWGASGWRYKVLAETDSTDYSAPGIDDSAWPTGTAPFASGTAGGTYAARGWVVPTSPFALPDANRTVWMRRSIDLSTAGSATISARIDGQIWVYLDGTLIGSWTSSSSVADVGPWAVPSNLLGGTRVLAVKALDDVADPVGDYTYVDVQVVTE